MARDPFTGIRSESAEVIVFIILPDHPYNPTFFHSVEPF